MKHVVALLTLLLLPCLPVLAAQPRLLVVESYEAGNSWDHDYLEGLRGSLDGQFQINTFEMDTKRLPPAAHPQQAEKAWQKITADQPAMVVLGDDNALKYLGPRLLDSSIPVVYLGINNNPADYVPSGHNLTGILERPLFEFCIRTVEQILQPAPRRLLVLFDNGTTSRASVAGAFKGKATQLISSTIVELKLIDSWDAWQQAVLGAKKDGYDAIIVGLYHTLTDRAGKNVPAAQVLQWTSANSPLPPFTFWDFSVGSDKTIGGFVLSGKEQGKAAAEMVKQIAAGTPPQNIPPKVGENGMFLFSRKQLKHWGLGIPAQIAARATWVE